MLTTSTILVLAIFSFFIALIFTPRWKLNASFTLLVGALLMVTATCSLGLQTPLQAFMTVDFNVITAFIGLELVSLALADVGFYSFISLRIAGKNGMSFSSLLFQLSIITFLLSLFLNNLITIIIMGQITIQLAKDNNLNPVPFFAAEIIVSNLAGASTHIGDFPNMLIATASSLEPWRFIVYMMAPCLAVVVLTVLFISWNNPVSQEADGNDTGNDYTRDRSSAMVFLRGSPHIRRVIGEETAITPGDLKVPERDVKEISSFILTSTLFNVFALPMIIPVPLGCMALFSAVIAIIAVHSFRIKYPVRDDGASRDPIGRILGKINVQTVLFLSCLFVLVGAVQSTNLLSELANALLKSSSDQYMIALVILTISAISTCFMGAGPSTALWIPIILNTGISLPGHCEWWALSLGVCAGSSATIIGATGGPIAMNMLDEAIDSHGKLDAIIERRSEARWKKRLDIRGYSRQYGLPAALCLWGMSAFYLLGLIRIGPIFHAIFWSFVLLSVAWFIASFNKGGRTINDRSPGPFKARGNVSA